jgi:hypothetical protein
VKLEKDFYHLRMNLIVCCKISQTECRSTIEIIAIPWTTEWMTCVERRESPGNVHTSLLPALLWGAPVSFEEGDDRQERPTELQTPAATYNGRPTDD